jgi:ribosomal protein S21
MLLMKDKGGYFIIIFGAILAIVWLIWGYSIFFDPLSFDYKWARGELGDFVGGGLGGITVVFITYTVWLQIGQINSQKNETFEAGVFRIFEALKPEVEGLSVRIVSKAIKAKIVSDDDEPFDAMLKKFRSGDRTVFLRAMQKSKYCNAIRSDYDDKDLEESMKRFESIMALLDKSLRQTVKNDDDDFSKAIKSTEIYETYRKCFLGKLA